MKYEVIQDFIDSQDKEKNIRSGIHSRILLIKK